MIHLGKIRWIKESELHQVIEDAKYDLKQLQEHGIQYACIINELDIPYNINISEEEKNIF